MIISFISSLVEFECNECNSDQSKGKLAQGKRKKKIDIFFYKTQILNVSIYQLTTIPPINEVVDQCFGLGAGLGFTVVTGTGVGVVVGFSLDVVVGGVGVTVEVEEVVVAFVVVGGSGERVVVVVGISVVVVVVTVLLVLKEI